MGRVDSSPTCPTSRAAGRASKKRSGTPRAGRPPRGPEQARTVVLDWITSAGLVPTEERIGELLPVARVWAPQYRLMAIKLVADGQMPTRAAVTAATARMIAEKKQAAARRRAEVAGFVAECGPDAAAWVRRYRDTHGHGPLWSELGAALELSRRLRQVTIHALEREGWISTGRRTRSMRPGPRAHHTPAAEPPGVASAARHPFNGAIAASDSDVKP